MSRGLLTPVMDAPVDWVCPVNWMHSLNRGLVSWFLCVPGATGGKTWPDLCRNHTATLTNMDPQLDWALNRRQGGWGCLDFDGSNDYVQTTIVRPTPTDNFTWSAWCKMDGSANTPDQKTIVGARTSSGTLEIILYQERDGVLQVQTEAATSSFGVSISFGAWAQYVMSWDGTTMRGYKNGTIAPSTATPTWGITLSANLQIGAQGTTFDELFGQMDDVRIYNRCLSSLEIKSLYEISQQYNHGLLNRVRWSLPFVEAASAVIGTIPFAAVMSQQKRSLVYGGAF